MNKTAATSTSKAFLPEGSDKRLRNLKTVSTKTYVSIPSILRCRPKFPFMRRQLYGTVSEGEIKLSAIIGRVYAATEARNDGMFGRAFHASSSYGPDGSAVLHDRELSIGLKYLHVSRDAADHQAPHGSDRLSVVADIVLDNRSEILAALKCDPASSDADLIAGLFEKFGPGFVNQISGDYAMAIYVKSERKLFLIRDHIGTRPLYWRRVGTDVIFGSDIRSLTQFSDMSWDIDERAFARFVMAPNRSPEKTMFVGLEEVAPGHIVEIGQDGIRSRRWWDPRNAPDIRFTNNRDYVERFRELVNNAVRTKSNVAGRLGSHISGGIDSSTVTYLAGHSLHRAYSWSPAISDTYPDLGPRDERRNVARICDDIGVEIKHTTYSASEFYKFHQRPIEFLGTADLADEVSILEQAASDGIRVMLSGWGGDEAYSAHGFGHVAKLIGAGRLVQAFQSVRRLAGGRRNPKLLWKTFMDWGVSPLAPDWMYNRITPFEDAYLGGAFPSQHVRQIAPESPKWQGEDVRMLARPTGYLCSLLLMGHLGVRMGSWAAWSAPHKIQYRYPLTDRALIDFVLGIPDELYTADGYGRFLARTAFKGELPDYLSKQDIASEKLRADVSMGCWSLICDDDQHGKFPLQSRWIDLTRYRQALHDRPETFDSTHIRRFAKVSMATKVLSFEGRRQ